MKTHTRPTLNHYLSLRYSAGGQPVTQLFSQRLGALIAWLAQQAGISPNQLTLIAGLLSTLGSVSLYFSLDHPLYLLVSLVLLQLAYAFDCADGQLARATGLTSKLGAWLDVSVDFYTIGIISTGLLMFMAGSDNHSVGTIIVIMIFTIARNLSLFGSTYIRQSNQESVHSRASTLRHMAKVLIDTPVILFLMVILTLSPSLLMSYLLLSSALLLLHVWHMGRRIL